MNANAYSEDQMIQAGTADFFAEHLGWRSEYAFGREDFGPNSLFGRSHRGEVVLPWRLRQALRKLNPKAPPAAIEAAISQLVDAEERRFVREGFDNDEQLAIFDLLPRLEQRKVLADCWRERAASRAQVETAILDHLYKELPEETFDENEVRLLSARVLGLLMRPGHDFGYHPGSAGAHAVRGKVTGGVQDAGVACRFS